MNRTLKLGTAYHGNRILRHVEEDMTDIVRKHMNTVVHMFTHNDMDRHSQVMKDIIALSEDKGLEVWVDNWGVDAGPGDKSYFTGLHPECKQVFRNGKQAPLKPCYNQQAFRDFTRQWVDAVAEAGGKTLFWDEPRMASDPEAGMGCFCPECQRKFEERHHKSLFDATDAELEAHRNETIADYFRFATDYAHECGLVNTGCIMFAPQLGSGFSLIDALMSLPHFDNVGCDPYWVMNYKNPTPAEVYAYNYDHTKTNLDMCRRFGKDHNIWLQAFAVPRGREDELVIAADALYDAGARTILSWSFRAGESNNYRSACPEMVWEINGEIMAHLRNRHFQAMLDEVRASR